jgi:hypothetical protein
MHGDILREPDGETGGDDGVGCVGQVICNYPYVRLNVMENDGSSGGSASLLSGEHQDPPWGMSKQN